MKRRLTERTREARFERCEIEDLAHQRHDEPRFVILGHEVLHAGWKELCLIDFLGAKMLAHGAELNQTRGQWNSDYPRRFLETSGDF